MDRFTCKLCSRAYTSKVYFEKHLRLKHYLYNYDRNNAVKTDSDKTTCNNDSDSKSTDNTNEKPYKCNACHTRFSIPSLLETHSEFGHCVLFKTDVSDDDLNSMNENIDDKSKNKEVNKTKKMKGRMYPRTNRTHNLKVHAYSDTKEQPFACDICDKKFRTNYQLKIHKCLHSGERPFKCKSCDKLFADHRTLAFHIRSHEHLKPYRCSICLKTFSHSSRLIIHNRSHTGERPYPCTMCEMRFKSTNHLIRHIRIHTGEKPYSCKHCNMKFSRSDFVTKHIRHKHDKKK